MLNKILEYILGGLSKYQVWTQSHFEIINRLKTQEKNY